MSTVLLTRGTHGVAAGGGLDLRPRWGGCRPKTVVVSGDPTLLPGHRSAWSQALLRKRGAEERGGKLGKWWPAGCDSPLFRVGAPLDAASRVLIGGTRVCDPEWRVVDLRSPWCGGRSTTVMVSGEPALFPGHRNACSQALLRQRRASGASPGRRKGTSVGPGRERPRSEQYG